jgi:hypothetical protein
MISITFFHHRRGVGWWTLNDLERNDDSEWPVGFKSAILRIDKAIREMK